MKIGICGEFIGMKSGGPETYITNLITSLAEIDRTNEYRIYVVRRDKAKNLYLPESNFHICPLRVYNSWVRHLIIRPLELMSRPVDILHVQDIAPIAYSGKLIATIHDISFELFPDSFPRAMRYRLSKLVKRTATKADVVLAVSENTKKDLVGLYGIPPSKVEVIPNGCNQRYKPLKDKRNIDRIKEKHGIIGRFILYVGAIQPRKNIAGLVEAYDLLRGRYGLELKLVIVGKKAWLHSDIFEIITNAKCNKDIIYLDYIPENELPFIYNAADLFVYPSFYEGFGLTVLEAMACGVPVVTSNNSSLPEVVGDAGVLVDPYNREELTQAMYEVMTQPSLRTLLAQKGIERSKHFSWRYTAEQTLRAYEKTFNRNEKSELVRQRPVIANVIDAVEES